MHNRTEVSRTLEVHSECTRPQSLVVPKNFNVYGNCDFWTIQLWTHNAHRNKYLIIIIHYWHQILSPNGMLPHTWVTSSPPLYALFCATRVPKPWPHSWNPQMEIWCPKVFEDHPLSFLDAMEDIHLTTTQSRCGDQCKQLGHTLRPPRTIVVCM